MCTSNDEDEYMEDVGGQRISYTEYFGKVYIMKRNSLTTRAC
ncbi:unnamed protein product, partial [Allacma fusca]